MTLTNIDIYIKNQGSFLANASLEFDNCFIIPNVRLVKTNNKPYHLDFPTRPILIPCTSCCRSIDCLSKYCQNCGTQLTIPNLDKTYRYVCFPINAEFRIELEKLVSQEYENVSKRRDQDCRLVS